MYKYMKKYIDESRITPFSRIILLLLPIIMAFVIYTFFITDVITLTTKDYIGNNFIYVINSFFISITIIALYVFAFWTSWAIEIFIYSLYCWIWDKTNLYAEISAYSKKRVSFSYKFFIVPPVFIFMFLFAKNDSRKPKYVKAKELLINGQ